MTVLILILPERLGSRLLHLRTLTFFMVDRICVLLSFSGLLDPRFKLASNLDALDPSDLGELRLVDLEEELLDVDLEDALDLEDRDDLEDLEDLDFDLDDLDLDDLDFDRDDFDLDLDAVLLFEVDLVSLLLTSVGVEGVGFGRAIEEDVFCADAPAFEERTEDVLVFPPTITAG